MGLAIFYYVVSVGTYGPYNLWKFDCEKLLCGICLRIFDVFEGLRSGVLEAKNARERIRMS